MPRAMSFSSAMTAVTGRFGFCGATFPEADAGLVKTLRAADDLRDVCALPFVPDFFFVLSGGIDFFTTRDRFDMQCSTPGETGARPSRNLFNGALCARGVVGVRR